MECIRPEGAGRIVSFSGEEAVAYVRRLLVEVVSRESDETAVPTLNAGRGASAQELSLETVLTTRHHVDLPAITTGVG